MSGGSPAGARPEHAVVHADLLRALTVDSFTGVGLPGDDAAAIADVLVYADLRALDAHGIHRIPAYMERVRRGLAGGTQDLVEVAGRGASRRVDAGFALGPAGATRATDLAVALAAEHGVGLVALGRSTHFGAAGYYVSRMARGGMVGIVTSNGPRGVAPAGAAEAFLGTNPLAIGIPLGARGEFVLDMSTSAIPRERIRQAASAGAALPPDVAIDAAGEPTTDPRSALEGSVLPMAGPKGSGLGLAILLLAGLLCDAEFDDEIGSMERDFDRPQDVGQVFVAIDPEALTPRERAARRLEALVDRFHGLRPAGEDRVAFPGERSEQRARMRLAKGVPVPRERLSRIAQACDAAGLHAVADRARGLAVD
jgi:LDH2 family malate/lactate/ureidoglycolate dehydrogenase